MSVWHYSQRQLRRVLVTTAVVFCGVAVTGCGGTESSSKTSLPSGNAGETPILPATSTPREVTFPTLTPPETRTPSPTPTPPHS